jgi:hypothetical protein
MPRVGAPVPSGARERITQRAASLPVHRLRLRFDTPLRLKADGEILHVFRPNVLVHRILERWESLRREYMAPGQVDVLATLRAPVLISGMTDLRPLLASADRIEITENATRWEELSSYSSRQRRFTPIGGLVGHVTLAGDLEFLRAVLVLGEIIHAGKDVVKGNGCYTVLDGPPMGGDTTWS